MNQQVQRAAANERGPEPDALQKIARDFSERKRAYLVTGVIATVIVAAILIVKNTGGGSDEDHFSPVWDAYADASARILENRPAADELAALDRKVETTRGTKAEGAALWLSAIAHYGAAFTNDKLSFEDRRPDLEAAKARLEELNKKKFDYFPPAVSRWFTTSGTPPLKELARQVDADLAWAKEHTYVEPQADASPTAVLRTDEGDIHLRFYSALAPRHVANFLELARAGTYNGTAFHFVEGGPEKLGVAAGDPFSYFYNDALKKDHILRWGHGGTGYNVPPEESRFRIVHRRGTVTAQRRENADWDNGAQFRIVLDTDPTLDRTYSPFAVVVEGMNVADKAASRTTAAEHPTFKDEPVFQSMATQGLIVKPVWIEKVIVYDESGSAMEHSFPLDEGEKKLATLKDTPLKPLQGKDLRANRTLVDPRETKDYRPGIDIPYPSDISNPKDEKPEGDRRVAGDATAEGQKPAENSTEKPAEKPSEKPSGGAVEDDAGDAKDEPDGEPEPDDG